MPLLDEATAAGFPGGRFGVSGTPPFLSLLYALTEGRFIISLQRYDIITLGTVVPCLTVLVFEISLRFVEGIVDCFSNVSVRLCLPGSSPVAAGGGLFLWAMYWLIS